MPPEEKQDTEILNKDQIKLELEKLKLEREKLEFERKKKEEKFFIRNFGSIIAGLISFVAVLVSVGQVYTAQQQRQIASTQLSIAEHQTKLSAAQTVERFIPHLVGEDTKKELALITMDSFVDRDVVTKLATKLPSKGSEAALQTLVSEGKEEEKELAQKALDDFAKKRVQLVEQMFDADKNTRINATTQLIKEWNTDPKVVSLALERAKIEQDKGERRNDSGIINTLVLLQSISPNILKPYEQEIVPFIERAKGNGPQTAKLVSSINLLITRTGADK